jgi:hypothetical protein
VKCSSRESIELLLAFSSLFFSSLLYLLLSIFSYDDNEYEYEYEYEYERECERVRGELDRRLGPSSLQPRA